MLNEVHAVLPASDLKRAQEFYHNALGLDPDREQAGNLVYRLGSGSSFEIYETENAGSAKNTQMCWITDDIDGDMARLRERGVTFEDYDNPGLKTENGVATIDGEKAAWFRDTEGNFLCLSQSM
jgi:catechol 2,3-dioxygenase-like lactoylglutathione lyase family enzyme